MSDSTDRTTSLLSDVLDDLARVVDVDASRLGAPTPCADFDVAALRTHVVGWLSTFADGFADPDGRAPRADLAGFEPSDDAAAEVRDATGRLVDALRAGGAERPLSLGGAAMPGELALGMVLWEYQTHGWDLARATGQPWSPAAEGLEQSLVFAPMMLTPDYQGVGKSFAPAVPVPDDAPPLDRLLGLSGRDPGWTPPVS
ncbi:TIGR03086 family metal-binding protein [Solicola sp. PLA-1-18]|uniref:TIGR03086 family metal-binding protein n=1 Tax=Solicola sp. PLA-1-18 TaxID=3380532 RepID=UPI003B7732B0